MTLGEDSSALVELALALAAGIDQMGAEERVRMLPQHSGQLMSVLRELRKRSVAAEAPSRPRRPSRLDQMREARGQAG